MTSPEVVDVLVVGAGNAAVCAALAARETGASVRIIESAPRKERGGNTAFHGGIFRFAYRGVDDLLAICPDISANDLANTDFGSYDEQQYFDDLARMSRYQADADLIALISEKSFETAQWLYQQGVRFQPSAGRQSYSVDGKRKVWGGVALIMSGGGAGELESLFRRAEAQGIDTWYRCEALSLLMDGTHVGGVRARRDGEAVDIPARAVILACGGFEASPEMRARYLGPGWDVAPVRGSKYNTGRGLTMALDAGAASTGLWSGKHAPATDINTPRFGIYAKGDTFQRHNFPLGIMINADGERFVDEGSDIQSYTYSQIGNAIIQQRGHFAYQIYDGHSVQYLRDEYRTREATKVEAHTVEELAELLPDVHTETFLRTIREFNEAVDTSKPFNPNGLDGRGTVGLSLNKSNWANPLDQAPFVAYGVTAGVTFTFGGLKVNDSGEVLNLYDEALGGVYAAGELVGGIYYDNYAGGTGSVAGAVIGRTAGYAAGNYSQNGQNR